MSFESQRRLKNLLIVSGAIAAVGGMGLLFTDLKIAGVILLTIGLVVAVSGTTMSNLFFRFDMKEAMEKHRDDKK